MAYALGIGFLMVRKGGKLPPGRDGASILRTSYDMEYGSNELEISNHNFSRQNPTGLRVVITDDLMATGGTALAASRLLSDAGVEVHEVAVIIELTNQPLEGRAKLKKAMNLELFSVLRF